MEKKKVVRYFLLYDAYNRDDTFKFNDEQLSLINEINMYARENPEFNELINRLKNTNYYDRTSVINEFYDRIEEKEKKDEVYEKKIAKIFGIDVSKIKHKILNTGVEIFSFYDFNAGRMVVLENRKDGKSLVEQLKEMQKDNVNYQSSNNEKNAHDMLSDSRVKTNVELDMIPVNEINRYLEQIKSLKKDDYKALIFLIRNASRLGIDYINVENMMGITKSGKIYEVRPDAEKEFQIGEPDGVVYNENDIDISNRQDEEIYNDYEDEGYIHEEEPYDAEFNYLDEQEKEKTIMLYENQQELDKLSEDAKNKYMRYIEMYKKYLLFLEAQARRKKNHNVRKKILMKDDSKGFANMNSIALIMEFAIISTITYVLFNLIFK